MRDPDPAAVWLEEQAECYAAQLANPDVAALLPAAPAYLAYPGAEQSQHLRLTRSTVPVTGGVAHVAVDGPLPDGLAAALDDLARTVQRNHSGEATP